MSQQLQISNSAKATRVQYVIILFMIKHSRFTLL